MDDGWEPDGLLDRCYHSQLLSVMDTHLVGPSLPVS
jgi:hypothetical protein